MNQICALLYLNVKIVFLLKRFVDLSLYYKKEALIREFSAKK